MSALMWLRACWECDGCGKNFVVDIDPVTKPEVDLYDTAKVAVSNGDIVDTNPKHETVGACSIQLGMILCDSCTETVDNHIETAGPLKTEDEIKSIISRDDPLE